MHRIISGLWDTDSVFVNLLGTEITFDEAQLVGNSIANTVTGSLVKPMELVFDSYARPRHIPCQEAVCSSYPGKKQLRA